MKKHKLTPVKITTNTESRNIKKPENTSVGKKGQNKCIKSSL